MQNRGRQKAVIYVRVSSKEQEREGFSIPAQKKYLNEYALKNDLTVVKIFEESESAKSAGRSQFKKLIEFLSENHDVCHLLVEKTDRLYRNLKDYNRLDPTDWPHLTIHLAKENEVLSKDSKSHQKLIHGIKVLMAKNYSDNLSEEVQKGMNQKALQGLWPSCAPIGYVNNREKHTIEPDPQIGPIITRAFDLALTGQYSLTKLKQLLHKEGLCGRRSRGELAKSQMQRILSNPIYHGDFIWKGVYYKGSHAPLVSKKIFDEVQVQMGFVKRSKATKYSFAFTNVMTCSHCGCSITAQEKRKKSGRTYIYYHCASGKAKCSEITYIREEKVESWIAEALSQIQVPENIIDWTKQALRESHDQEKAYHQKQVKLLDDRYRTIKNKINKTYEENGGVDGTRTRGLRRDRPAL
jgi:site-specific DNA recombinase